MEEKTSNVGDRKLKKVKCKINTENKIITPFEVTYNLKYVSDIVLTKDSIKDFLYSIVIDDNIVSGY